MKLPSYLKKTIFTATGIILAVALVVYVFAQVDRQSLFENLASMQLAYLLPIFVIYCANIFIRALRWRLFYPADVKASLWASYCALVMGNASNLFIPARGGDIVRVIALGKLTGLSNSVSLATIVSERVFDLLLLCLFIGGIASVVALDESIRLGATIIALISISGVLFLLAFVFVYKNHHDFVDTHIIKRLPTFLHHRVHELLQGLASGLHLIFKTTSGLMFLFYTGLIWITELGIVYLLSKGLALDIELLHTITVFLCTIVGTLIPLTAAQIGVFEFIVVSTLENFGYDSAKAFALGIVWHSVILLYPIILGALVWIFMPRSVKSIKKEAMEAVS